MICPVCQTPHIPEQATTCPHCKSGLGASALLKAIGEQQEQQRQATSQLQGKIFRLESDLRKQSRKTVRSTGIAVVLFLCCLFALWRWWTAPKTVLLSEYNSDVKAYQSELLRMYRTDLDLNARIDTLKNIIESLRQPVVVVQPEPKPASPELTHVVKVGESFYSLAVAYYHDAKMCNAIATYNHRSVHDIIHPGETLRLKARKEDY